MSNTRLHSPSASIRIQSSKWVCHPICMLLSASGSIPAFASVYFCLESIWAASMCICVCVSVCHSTPLSRHAALLLPQYACSRIPAPLFLYSSPHRNPYLFLSVMDLLAVLPPSLRWNISSAEAETGWSISWMSVVCVSVCVCSHMAACIVWVIHGN